MTKHTEWVPSAFTIDSGITCGFYTKGATSKVLENFIDYVYARFA